MYSMQQKHIKLEMLGWNIIKLKQFIMAAYFDIIDWILIWLSHVKETTCVKAQ